MRFKKSHFKNLALLLGILLLVFFFSQVDFKEVWANLQEVGWRFVYIILVTAVAYWLAVGSWYLCFGKMDVPISIMRLFYYRQIGETLAVINPTSVIAGDSAKVFMLKSEGIDFAESTSSILLSRIMIMLSLVVLLILSSFFFLDTLNVTGSATLQIFVISSLCVGQIGVMYMLVSPQLYLHKIFFSISRPFTNKLLKRQLTAIKAANEAMAFYYKNYRLKLYLSFILAALHWIMGAAEFYIILGLLGVKIAFISAIMLEMGVIFVKSLGSFIPGQLGVEEYGNKLMLEVIGVTIPGIWVAVSILRRARQMFWLLVGGALFLLIYKKL